MLINCATLLEAAAAEQDFLVKSGQTADGVKMFQLR